MKKAFCLPHSVAFEPYVRAFQFKILNSILYTNSKLHKIGCRLRMIYVLSAMVKQKQKQCSISFMIALWRDFELYYLSLTNQQIHLNLKDILIGFLTPELPLLNYLLLTGKIYIWACRRNKELPSIRGFKS